MIRSATEIDAKEICDIYNFYHCCPVNISCHGKLGTFGWTGLVGPAC
jgi:hypothetical protein